MATATADSDTRETSADALDGGRCWPAIGFAQTAVTFCKSGNYEHKRRTGFYCARRAGAIPAGSAPPLAAADRGITGVLHTFCERQSRWFPLVWPATCPVDC